jgi:hypothetical protein
MVNLSGVGVEFVIMNSKPLIKLTGLKTRNLGWRKPHSKRRSAEPFALLSGEWVWQPQVCGV